MIAVRLKIDGERVLAALKEASEKLEGAEGEVILDFSSVRRVETGALQELSALTAAAEQKGVTLVAHGVSPELYKILKLTEFAPRLKFAG